MVEDFLKHLRQKTTLPPPEPEIGDSDSDSDSDDVAWAPDCSKESEVSSVTKRKRDVAADPALSFLYYSGFPGHGFVSAIKNIFDFDGFQNGIMEKIKDVEGVYSPMLFIGTEKSMFPLHVEDFAFSSFNFHHGGCEKVWIT